MKPILKDGTFSFTFDFARNFGRIFNGAIYGNSFTGHFGFLCFFASKYMN